MIDKNKAVVEYLTQCPQIADNPLFFNFVTAKDNNKQFLTSANDKTLNAPYIDGSVYKQYSFTIIDFRSVTFQPVVKLENYPNENMEEMFDIQGIIDWITEQNDLLNFPDFGEDCVVEEIAATTSSPNLDGVDTSLTPVLAKYSIVVKIKYLDKSKAIWK